MSPRLPEFNPSALSQPGVGEGEFTAADDTRLFYRWSRVPEPGAVVAFVHGLVEHSGRYGALAHAVNAGGINYYALDHRGHGKSAGARAEIHSFADYVDDFAVFCRKVVSWERGLPFFIVGHSMGSLIAALYAARQDVALSGIALASLPAELLDGPTTPKLLIARLFAAVLPRVTVPAGLDPATLSHNAAVIQDASEDPLMQKRISLRLAVNLLAEIRALPKIARRIRAPALVMHGSEDSVSSPASARKLLEWLSSTDKHLLEFPGLRHELFMENDPGRAHVFSELTQWISRHIP
jgi:acylglycerol lipase